MRFILFLAVLFAGLFTQAQNVGIGTLNPQEQLHLRSDSNRIALRMDSRKSGGVGFNYSTVMYTPSAVQNFESSPTYEDWTDLTVSKLLNSDDVRMNGPQIGLVPDLSNGLRIQFTPGAAIPSTAEITNVTLNAEWRRNGTFAGTLGFGISLLRASNNLHLLSFPAQFVTSSTDIGVTVPYQQLVNTVTADMMNLSDVYILLLPQFSYADGSTRLEIDRLWLEVEYREAAATSENVFWSMGAEQGNFKISKSGNLATNSYFSIDESGVTQVKGFKLLQNAGAGKILTSNNDGRAYWADPPVQNEDLLWIKKQDTAYYATGPVQINNTAGKPALIFDKGASKINNGINLIETNNRLLNIIVDANNDQTNEQYNIYRDSTGFLAQEPAVRFSLDSNDSWINGSGNVGIGKTTPTEKLDINGAVRLGNTSNLSPQAGTVRYNETKQLFEGFDGTQWRSLVSQFEKAGTLVRSIGNHSTDDFVFGADSLPPAGLSSNSAMLFDKDKSAFRVGSIANSDNWAPINIGFNSFATGYNTKASGSSSFAAGLITKATGTNSSAFGYITTASGNNSTALGDNTTASGPNSTAMGVGTEAYGANSTAMGGATTATGFNSTALGILTLASGHTSIAMGENTQASGRTSASIGLNTIAKGFASTVIGMNNDSILVADQTVISPTTPLFIIGNGDDENTRTNAMVVNKNGRLGLGLNLPGHPIHHSNGARLTAAGIWTDASDRRLKSAIKPIQYGLNQVMKLQPSTYTVNATGEQHIGFIAQDLKTIIPEVVNGTEGDIKKGETLGVSYGNLVAVLTKAIQEQQEMILAQKHQIEEMQKQIMELMEKNKK